MSKLPDPPPPKIDPRVLIVEDEPRLRELLARAIGGWGFEVAQARSGEEALRLAAEQPPDIALLDLNLPGVDGIETFRRLRVRVPGVQGIVLTGFASLDAARQAIHLDVVEFLTKPAPLGELEQALDRALRRIVPAAPTVLPDERAREANDAAPDDAPPAKGVGTRTLEEVEREHILAALRRNGGNRTATAAQLGISRRTLYYKLGEYARLGHLVE
jgi:DNA-binding NtrC family response regulator